MPGALISELTVSVQREALRSKSWGHASAQGSLFFLDEESSGNVCYNVCSLATREFDSDQWVLIGSGWEGFLERLLVVAAWWW